MQRTYYRWRKKVPKRCPDCGAVECDYGRAISHEFLDGDNLPKLDFRKWLREHFGTWHIVREWKPFWPFRRYYAYCAQCMLAAELRRPLSETLVGRLPRNSWQGGGTVRIPLRK